MLCFVSVVSQRIKWGLQRYGILLIRASQRGRIAIPPHTPFSCSAGSFLSPFLLPQGDPRLIVNETLKSLNCCSNPGEISIFVAQMMRKSATLLLSFLLSTMIVWIGSGILTVVCEHTGNVSLASVPSKKHCNTADDGHCMKLQMKTLSPTDMAPTGIHQVLPVQFSLLPQLLTLPQLLPLPILAKVPGRMSPLLWHGSARQYLRMLTTLLI